ncbi:hypothetical protein CEXT_625241 [Caerostris extrusa]|uniref:Uncharacterized protein n=1 Tax=Caerostris extrusa TaxID=172846 RepID=A0AAV4NFC9_CAEEX|nr:hypothetical protein CEXT_625241 [Caerostris extrusa]
MNLKPVVPKRSIEGKYKGVQRGRAINCYLGGFGCQKGAVLNVWGSGSIFQVPPLSEPVHMWCQGPNEVTGSDSSVSDVLEKGSIGRLWSTKGISFKRLAGCFWRCSSVGSNHPLVKNLDKDILRPLLALLVVDVVSKMVY